MKSLAKGAIFIMFAILCSKMYAAELHYPIHYGVYQRNGNTFTSTAKIQFMGTVAVATNAQFKIEKLNQFGTIISTPYTYSALNNGTTGYVMTNIPNGNGYESNYFKFELTLQTGWYQVTIKDGNNSTSFTKKFGVGEVFVIAGQSNAQGEGATIKITTSQNYDCVVSAKGGLGDYGVNPINYSKITGGGIFMGTLHSDGKIFPMGDRAWCYQELGNKIASGSNTPPSTSLTNVVPVAFFNCANSGTSVQQWKNSMDRVMAFHNNNYSNPILSNWNNTSLVHKIPWGYDRLLSDPYFGFQTVISYCANIFRLRAIIWHQGEAETKMLLSKQYSNSSNNPKIKYSPVVWNGTTNDQDFTFYNGYDVNNYDTNLTQIINDSRNLVGTSSTGTPLVWAISKVSLIGEAYSGDAIVDGKAVRNGSNLFHEEIVSNSNKLIIPNFFQSTPQIKEFTLNGSSVIQEQQNLVNTVSNVTWASQNSDSFLTNKRNANPPSNYDYTHFNMAGLMDLAQDYFTNITSNVFTRQPILPKLMPFVQYNGASGGTYTLATPSSHTFTYRLWSNSFTRTSPSSSGTIFSTTGFTGFLYGKTSNGAIYISNLVRVGNLSGLRVASPQADLVYPNPAESGSMVSLDIESFKEEKVSIILLRENGEQLDKIEEHSIGEGTWNYNISIPKHIGAGEKVYARVIMGGKEETQRILIK